MVALGIAYNNADESLHNLPIPVNHLRVQIDTVIENAALLPVPIDDEVKTIEDAVGCFVAWPTVLIEAHEIVC